VYKVRNGYLGWHYMDGVDTCLYLSPPYRFLPGENTITWNGCYESGRQVYRDICDYYLWGYDASSPGVKATVFISPRRFAGAHIQTGDKDGHPLANPIIFDALPASFVSDAPVQVVRSKWALGSDPKDVAYLETTSYLTASDASRMAPDPADPFRFFFTESARVGAVVLRKWGWTPNGEAALQTGWRPDGEVAYPAPVQPYRLYLPPSGGPVSDGADRIFFPCVWPLGEENRIPNIDSGIAVVDAERGDLMHRLDLSSSWSNPPDAINHPGFVEFRDGMLFVSSPLSCLVQMIDPASGDASGMVRWENGYGDGIWDKPLPEGGRATWRCFGLPDPPNPENIAVDAHRFSLFPATGLDATSFGVLAPDGSGLGYFLFPGMEGRTVRGVKVVDSSSAFDGIYYTGTEAGEDSAGVWFRSCDSIRGIIAHMDEPLGPGIRITYPVDDDRMTPGTVRSIVWGSNGVTAVRIDFSSDGGATWSAVADSVAAEAGEYRWTVPNIGSSQCKFRIVDVSDTRIYHIMRGYFTIAGKTDVAEQKTPHLLLIANYPNPFNPSTTITFALPRAGYASLTIYDITGRKVTELTRGFHPAGRHAVTWNANHCASGVYFCTLRAGERVETRKMLLVR
jgi:hypothetical protein